MPKRIQRQRTKGWKAPEGAVYVGRPTRWGNPYAHEDPAVAVSAFKGMLAGDLSYVHGLRLKGRPVDRARAEEFRRSIKALRGKNLMCWCALDQPCHADVLLELANADPA